MSRSYECNATAECRRQRRSEGRGYVSSSTSTLRRLGRASAWPTPGHQAASTRLSGRGRTRPSARGSGGSQGTRPGHPLGPPRGPPRGCAAVPRSLAVAGRAAAPSVTLRLGGRGQGWPGLAAEVGHKTCHGLTARSRRGWNLGRNLGWNWGPRGAALLHPVRPLRVILMGRGEPGRARPG